MYVCMYVCMGSWVSIIMAMIIIGEKENEAQVMMTIAFSLLYLNIEQRP